jgi:hypothetical protein
MPGPRADRLRRELVLLVVLVVLVDALFIGGYALGGLARASAGVRLGYTLGWTGATLAVVLRGLIRIRAIRAGR